MSEKACDYVFKFILIGNGNSGKTSLLFHYIHGTGKKGMWNRKLECTIDIGSWIFNERSANEIEIY